MARVVISYRREEAADFAGRLYDRLKVAFGAAHVFLDIDTIPRGVDFVGAIDDAIGLADVVIAVIGPKWSTVTDERGQRRLDNPTDFVRLELAAALRRGIVVMPVLFGGAQMPQARELPHDLSGLDRIQAARIGQRFHSDADELIADVHARLVAHAEPDHRPGESSDDGSSDGEIFATPSRSTGKEPGPSNMPVQPSDLVPPVPDLPSNTKPARAVGSRLASLRPRLATIVLLVLLVGGIVVGLRDSPRIPDFSSQLDEAWILLGGQPGEVAIPSTVSVSPGDLEVAGQLIEGALEAESESARGHWMRGMYSEMLGRTDEAIAAYGEASRLDPQLPQPHHALGKLLWQSGHHQDAVAPYVEALRLAPEYLRLKDVRDVLTQFAVLVQFYPSTRKLADDAMRSAEKAGFRVPEQKNWLLAEGRLKGRVSELLFFSEIGRQACHVIQSLLERELGIVVPIVKSRHFGDQESIFKIRLNLLDPSAGRSGGPPAQQIVGEFVAVKLAGAKVRRDGWSQLPVVGFAALRVVPYSAKGEFDGDGCVQGRFRGVAFPRAEDRPRYGLGVWNSGRVGYELYVRKGRVFTVYERSETPGAPAVRKLTDGWESSEHVASFRDGTNQLRICRKGTLLRFYIDGFEVLSHTDSGAGSYTRFGVLVSAGTEALVRDLGLCRGECPG